MGRLWEYLGIFLTALGFLAAMQKHLGFIPNRSSGRLMTILGLSWEYRVTRWAHLTVYQLVLMAHFFP